MNCHEFEDRLNDVLDQRGQPQSDRLLTAHAGECDDCQRRLIGSRVLLRGLAKLSPPPLSRDFARRSVAQATESPRTIARPAARFWLACGVLLSSAAAALLAISVVWYARRGGEPLAQEPIAQENIQPRSEAPGGASRRKRSFAAALPGKAGPKTATYAAAGGDLLIEAPRLPDHLRGYKGAIDQLAIALPQTAIRIDEVDHLAPGFRPLRVSLTAIWDTLCRTIPGAHTDEQTPPRTRAIRWIGSGSQLA